MTEPLTNDRPKTALSRNSWRLAVALAVVVFAARLPLIQHPAPVHPDELNFVAGLGFPEPYPVHPPGYPLWVAMGTLMHQLGLPDYRAFQVWSFAASILLPLMFFAGLHRVCSASLAWWLALAAGLNPLIWFHAVTAMNYIPAAAVGLIVIDQCYQGVVRRSFRATCLATLVLLIGVFLRADLLIFLGPLVAYAAWRSRPKAWPAIIALAVGIGGYMELVSSLYQTPADQPHLQTLPHTIEVVFGTSVFHLGFIDGLVRNIVKIAMNVIWDMGIACVLIPPAIVSLIRSRRDAPQRFWVLILWAAPCLGFLLLMHVVQGYFVLLLLATYACLGVYLQSRFKPSKAARVAAIIALCSLAQFTLYPWSARSTGFKQLLDAKIAFLSAPGLRQIDDRATIHRPGDFWPTAAHEAQRPEPTSRPD